MIDGVERGWHLPAPSGETPTSWVIFQGSGYRVGAIRVPARHPRWNRVNDIPGLPVLWFPRTPVRIVPTGGGGGTVEAGCAIFLDSDERYERACLAEEGDRSDWFAFDEELLSRLAPALETTRVKSRRSVRIEVSAGAYALQRRAFRHALVAPDPDGLLLEEALCGVLEGLRKARRRSDDAPCKSGVRLVHALRDLVSARFRERLRLTDLADELGVTAPHLCRVFRRETGGTIHDYQEKLRLAAALDALEESASDLTGLALDLGYSSHAHFTANFTRMLGRAPSRMRTAMHAGLLS